MSPSDKAARSAILRRRALFISSVTALSGCSPNAPSAPTTSSAPVVQVEPVPAGSTTATTATTATAAQPKSPVGLPSLETPKGINERATQQFGWLHDTVVALHKRIDKAERDIPSDCAIVDAACDARWQALAKALLQIEENMPKMSPCPGSSEGAKLFEVRVKEHRAYAEKRKEDLSKRIQAAVAPLGDAGKQRWEAHMSAARTAFPRVCLNYSCKDW